MPACTVRLTHHMMSPYLVCGTNSTCPGPCFQSATHSFTRKALGIYIGNPRTLLSLEFGSYVYDRCRDLNQDVLALNFDDWILVTLNHLHLSSCGTSNLDG